MISATEPVQRAISWTDKVLFKPFDLGKWFTLGFCAFLSQLGQGGYNYRSTRAFGKAGGDPADPFPAIGGWISTHLLLASALGVGILVAIIGLMALFTWLSSRGQFMFLDGVARNRAEVREPWNRFRNPGNRLFRFRFVLGLILLAVVLVLAGGMALLVFRSIHHRFDALSIAGMATLGLVLMALMIGGVIFELLLRDFAVPVMFIRGIGPWDALKVLWNELLRGRGWDFTRFYLLKLALSLASLVLILAGCCLTCCIGMLPYLSSVVFLPIHVFFRSYSLLFMEQLGGEWRLIDGG